MLPHPPFFLFFIYLHFRALSRRFCPKRPTVIHTYIHTLMAVAAHQEQFGVQYLAQGHLNMQTRGIKPATFREQDAGSTPEPQLMRLCVFWHYVTELYFWLYILVLKLIEAEHHITQYWIHSPALWFSCNLHSLMFDTLAKWFKRERIQIFTQS